MIIEVDKNLNKKKKISYIAKVKRLRQVRNKLNIMSKDLLDYMKRLARIEKIIEGEM